MPTGRWGYEKRTFFFSADFRHTNNELRWNHFYRVLKWFSFWNAVSEKKVHKRGRSGPRSCRKFCSSAHIERKELHQRGRTRLWATGSPPRRSPPQLVLRLGESFPHIWRRQHFAGDPQPHKPFKAPHFLLSFLLIACANTAFLTLLCCFKFSHKNVFIFLWRLAPRCKHYSTYCYV